MTLDYDTCSDYICPMRDEDRQFTLDDLCSLADLPKRTVRYYIQIGLLGRPEGAGRGAHYSVRHLDQLLEIRKWRRAGLSLERIRELMGGTGGEGALRPPAPPRRKGSVEVWSHVVIDDGVELAIEPKRSGLSPEQVRKLTREVMALYERIHNTRE